MKFLADAQLPRRLATDLRQAGVDTVHTLELADGNLTQDAVLNQVSVAEQRVLITKDTDFVNSFLIRHEPWKLLLVSTGNIGNVELLAIFEKNIGQISAGFEIFDFIEINRSTVIFHS